ncbi:hypothetical protein [Mycoavidus sp. B2-EB]|uniref:hypothetical protein n=1 Tax=Mycoavidus sp. B2-EB TaxID=2651972 RepID=UPI001E4CFA6A|nr:hypothetical protein [Mycoavidus sp. B2-EB]BBO60064.1 hypothetical protein MPB2EB_1202 [Mycoavidus sp. B2-EB]
MRELGCGKALKGLDFSFFKVIVMIGGCRSKRGQCPTIVEESELIQRTPISLTRPSPTASQLVRFGNLARNRPYAPPSNEWILISSASARVKQRRLPKSIEPKPFATVLLGSLEPVGSVQNQNLLDHNMNSCGSKFTVKGPLYEQPACVARQVDSAGCQTKVSYRQKVGLIFDQAQRKILGRDKQKFHTSSKNKVNMKQAPISHIGISSIDISRGDADLKQLRQQRSIECALVGINKLFTTDADGVSNIQKFQEWLQKQDIESVAKLKKNADASGFMRSFTTALKLGITLLEQKETNFPQSERQDALVEIAEFYRENQKKLVPLGDGSTYSEEFFKGLVKDKNSIREIMILIRKGVELFRPFSQAEDIDGVLPEKEEIDAMWLRMDINPLSAAEKIWLAETPEKSHSFKLKKGMSRQPMTSSHSLRY